MNLTHWDVVVVGAGPAGAGVALAQPPGRRTLVLDRRRAPWRKACDGILTPMSRRALAAVGGVSVERCDLQAAEHLAVIDRDRNDRFRLALAGHAMVDRQALDTALRATFTARPGVAFLDRAEVRGWRDDGDVTSVTIRRDDEMLTVSTRFLVDASGAASLARGMESDRLPTALAVQFWYPPQGDRFRCDWIFDTRVTPYYLWAIHKPAGLAVGGVFPLAEGHRARRAVTRLAASLDVSGAPWRVQGARMAMPHDAADLCIAARGALIVGEAAGLINAGTGEGISFALRSGLLCGRAIAATARRADAVDLYRRAVIPLCEEAAIKAKHARDLFEVAGREAMPAERVLVAVPRTSLELLP